MSIFESSIPTDDQFAKQEQIYLYKKAKRKHQSNTVYHIIRLVFISVCAILIICILISRVVYLIYPDCWIKENQVAKLDEFLIHGTVGAIMVSLLKPEDKPSNIKEVFEGFTKQCILEHTNLFERDKLKKGFYGTMLPIDERNIDAIRDEAISQFNAAF